jgi:hypothetical protein
MLIKNLCALLIIAFPASRNQFLEVFLPLPQEHKSFDPIEFSEKQEVVREKLDLVR